MIEDGAKTLMTLSNIIDTSRMKAPAFCMVLTGVGDFAYKRTDGVCCADWMFEIISFDLSFYRGYYII